MTTRSRLLSLLESASGRTLTLLEKAEVWELLKDESPSSLEIWRQHPYDFYAYLQSPAYIAFLRGDSMAPVPPLNNPTITAKAAAIDAELAAATGQPKGSFITILIGLLTNLLPQLLSCITPAPTPTPTPASDRVTLGGLLMRRVVVNHCRRAMPHVDPQLAADAILDAANNTSEPEFTAMFAEASPLKS